VLVEEGALVAICARSQDKLEKTAAEIGAACAIATDLEKPGAARLLVEQVTARLGHIDILVINQGGPPKGKFLEVSSHAWELGFQALWQSSVEAIHAVLPAMTERGFGRIVWVTSMSAKNPIEGLTVSNGLRAGISGLVRSLAREVAGEGVTVNALLPGYVATERLEELGVSTEKIIRQIPAGRLARPEEIGSLAAFLASERGAYITGQSLSCDGGWG
jgi:3-oxoacyl-[acyl-carrier protein] reductase